MEEKKKAKVPSASEANHEPLVDWFRVLEVLTAIRDVSIFVTIVLFGIIMIPLVVMVVTAIITMAVVTILGWMGLHFTTLPIIAYWAIEFAGIGILWCLIFDDIFLDTMEKEANDANMDEQKRRAHYQVSRAMFLILTILFDMASVIVLTVATAHFNIDREFNLLELLAGTVAILLATIAALSVDTQGVYFIRMARAMLVRSWIRVRDDLNI